MSKSITDGGPAMPVEKGTAPGLCGMSLRDHFAGQALAGGFAEFLTACDAWDGYKDFAESCYCIADAMLVAREKRI